MHDLRFLSLLPKFTLSLVQLAINVSPGPPKSFKISISWPTYPKVYSNYSNLPVIIALFC